jgi:PPM family protein phosphatase
MADDPRTPNGQNNDQTHDREATARRYALSTLLGKHDTPPSSASVRVTIGARTHLGAVRHINEDHYLVVRLSRGQETLATSLPASDVPPTFAESGYAMLVADGLGLDGSGSVASRVALSTIAHLALHYGRWNLRIDPVTAEQVMERAEWFYAQADTAVHTRASSSAVLKGMTTALTIAYSAGEDLFIAHVGHSRAYLFRRGALTRLTRDDTIEQHLADTNRPAAIERRAQDLRHILTDAVGAQGAKPLVAVERFRLLDGDCVMLCTNGLTDMVNESSIAEVLAHRREPRAQCAMLIDLANRSGGADNITVVLAEYQVPAP